MIPLFNTSPTTTSASMLGFEYGVPLCWCLLAIIRYMTWRKPTLYKLNCMTANGIHTFWSYIIFILCVQVKFTTEFRLIQFLQCFFYGHSSKLQFFGFAMQVTKITRFTCVWASTKTHAHCLVLARDAQYTLVNMGVSWQWVVMSFCSRSFRG